MKIRILVIIIILAIIILVCKNIFSSYVFAIKMNWNINIPIQKKIIYKKESETSFRGEGQSYYILEYSNKKLKELEQKLSFDKNDEKIQKEIIKILEELEVPEKFYPNFNIKYKYLKKEEEPFSLIYILLLEDKLYVIEQLT